MRLYWDSSALINALVAGPVVSRLKTDEHFTRSHAYVEVFHHLTGIGLPAKGGGRNKVINSDAAVMIRALSEKLSVRDLSIEETLGALDLSRAAGVMGKMVHDWIHIRTAKLSLVDIVLTRDAGFAALAQSQGLKTEWP